MPTSPRFIASAFLILIVTAESYGWEDSARLPAGLPFTIEALEDVSGQFPEVPRLQSFAWAQRGGKWIFIGGRTTGYHGVGAVDADFPRAGSNAKIWVVDAASLTPKSFSFPVASLPAGLARVKDQWVASNLLFFQDKSTLYLAGGCGLNTEVKLVTHSVLSSVDLPSLVEGVTKGIDTFSKKIKWTTSPLVQSAGGELLKLDDGLFYLAGGHVFTGSYRDFEGANEQGSSTVSQKYLEEIRKLKVTSVDGQLSVF
jgi:hypothetical protein